MTKIKIIAAISVYLFCLSISASAANIDISGGGTGKIASAIAANVATGGTIVITDNQTYTETEVLNVGQRNGANGRVAFNIEAAAGQTPKIVLNGAGFVCYAGSANFHIGSNSGGRLIIDAKAAAIAGNGYTMFWYIGQEDGLASGAACQATFENLDIDMTGLTDGFDFGAGGNDPTPKTTGASLTVRNVTTTGGTWVISSLYGPATYVSSVNVENSLIRNPVIGGIASGRYALGDLCTIHVDHSIVYNAPGSSADPNGCYQAIAYKGAIAIDHSDLINESGNAAAEVNVGLVGGNATVTNSILRATWGTLDYVGAQPAPTVTDSNVTTSNNTGDPAKGDLNLGFTYTGCITEWPVYTAFGADPAVANFFKIANGKQTLTLGTTPPAGSKGAALQVPVALSGFMAE